MGAPQLPLDFFQIEKKVLVHEADLIQQRGADEEGATGDPVRPDRIGMPVELRHRPIEPDVAEVPRSCAVLPSSKPNALRLRGKGDEAPKEAGFGMRPRKINQS